MNNDLISREALLGILRKRGRELIKMNLIGSERTVAINTVYECVGIAKDAPAVDAVEVVRCKDCKHRGDGYTCPMHFAHMHCDDDDFTSDDGFCERGARMDLEVQHGEI